MKYYNLSLRQLKTILVVSEQKRLIKASELLSLTPPAVTIQLRQAEEEMGTVVSMKKVKEITLWDGSKGEGWLLKVKANVVLDGCSDGCSIAVNGVCLTALPGWTSETVTFGVSPETLRCTNLEDLKEGSRVNLERSLRADSRNSGHYVQGHVDCVGNIIKFKPEGDSLWVTIQTPKDIIGYIVRKGYIAVDGTSLTVCNVDENESCFDLMLVAHTQQCVSLAFTFLSILLYI